MRIIIELLSSALPPLQSPTYRYTLFGSVQFSSFQSLSNVQLFAIPWTAAHQASLFITNSRSSLKLMSIESVILFNQPSRYAVASVSNIRIIKIFKELKWYHFKSWSRFSFLSFLFFFFLLQCIACGIVVPWPGNKPRPSAVEAQNPSHWPPGKSPHIHSFTDSFPK